MMLTSRWPTACARVPQPTQRQHQNLREILANRWCYPACPTVGAHTSSSRRHPTETLQVARARDRRLASAHWRLSVARALRRLRIGRAARRRAADIVVMTSTTSVLPMEIAHDFPGGWRRIQRAHTATKGERRDHDRDRDRDLRRRALPPPAR
jgi:hypothetical protein